MIGWMQNWDTCAPTRDEARPWFGQMSLPRELSVQNGRLYQRPLRELEDHRSGRVEHRDAALEGELTLPGVEGRTVDLELTIRPQDGGAPCRRFTLRFAQDGRRHTALSFRPHESVLEIDRSFSGSRRACVHQRRCLVPSRDGTLKLRVILDRFSAEVFVNDGEQVLTAAITTDEAAKGISFAADGPVRMDVTKYDLFAEG